MIIVCVITAKCLNDRNDMSLFLRRHFLNNALEIGECNGTVFERVQHKIVKADVKGLRNFEKGIQRGNASTPFNVSYVGGRQGAYFGKPFL